MMIIDGHPMIREGVRKALKRARGISVCASAETVEVIQAAEELQPDIVVIDFRLSDDSGIDAIEKIRSHWPQTKVLVVTVFRDEVSLRKSIVAGASGYLVIDASELVGNEGLDEDLPRAVRAVAAGHEYVDPVVTKFVLDWARNSFEWIVETSTDAALKRLSSQEKRTLILMARGLANKEIAKEMRLSVKTVEGYVSSILVKLKAKSRTEAVTHVHHLLR